MRNIRRRREAVSTAKHDVKLKLDQECQAKAEGVLRRAFPRHAILGEEDTAERPDRATATHEWIIDPIDGTVNFSHGLPFWCCSIAVRSRGAMLAGAVFAPALDSLYTATVDQPARRNGTRLRVSSVSSLAEAMVFTGLDKSVDPRMPPFEIFRRLSANIQKARIWGSAALDLCQVAEGRGEGYYESGIYIWDVAAAGLIVQQAGGTAETLGAHSGHRLSFLASNGLLHRKLKRLVEAR